MCARVRLTAVRRMVVAGGVVLMVNGASPALLLASDCGVYTSFSNADRHLFGDVSEECGPGHTPPWGNWGVDSPHGSRQDANQFAGWKPLGGHRQWNSCTTNSPWRPGDVGHWNFYNHPPVQRIEQIADPDNSNVYASNNFHLSGTCENVMGGVFIYTGLYMKLYELDGGGPFGGQDDHVTTLNYGSVSIPMSCAGAWSCTGQSGWISPISGNSDVTANIRLSVFTYRR